MYIYIFCVNDFLGEMELFDSIYFKDEDIYLNVFQLGF